MIRRSAALIAGRHRRLLVSSAAAAPRPHLTTRCWSEGPNRPEDASHRRFLSTAAVFEPSSSSPAVFPSLILGANHSVTAQGSFAQSQAEFLEPDQDSIHELIALLERTQTGIVAHYYMDAELQGILHAVSKKLPGKVSIADSLAMGDAAVKMAENGVSNIACLGVDFMSESVQAILNYNKYSSIPVYRLDARKIGCSLAESAERETYKVWLKSASDRSLHVIYINTSLETKAISNSIVPTITCTSSNVLNTLLSASAQIPNLDIYYGPDTYMGENLITMLNVLSMQWSDEKIAKLHPSHNRDSLKTLRDSINVFPSGNCIVHHMFGESVVESVREHYVDTYITAHLEVPGEMFEIAMEYSLKDRGVVGSTSDILKFIQRKVKESGSSQKLRFILGTEAGMVTSIVQGVQQYLKGDKQVEIIFPVSSDAVNIADDETLVPGVAGGEGCSTAGGCATCPYMKMNSFDSLTSLLNKIGSNASDLSQYLPPSRLDDMRIKDRPAMEWAVEPIQYMRSFNANKVLPDELIQRVTN